MTAFTESVVEQAALAWLESAGWRILPGIVIAPGEPAAERDDYGQAVLVQCLSGFAGAPQPCASGRGPSGG
jgi:type I restriction enzyme R subunit